MQQTFTVRGHKIRSQSNRRYLVIAVRPAPVPLAGTAGKGMYVAFARVEKRTDNIKTARAAIRKYGHANGAFAVVIDAATGAEILSGEA